MKIGYNEPNIQSLLTAWLHFLDNINVESQNETTALGQERARGEINPKFLLFFPVT